MTSAPAIRVAPGGIWVALKKLPSCQWGCPATGSTAVATSRTLKGRYAWIGGRCAVVLVPTRPRVCRAHAIPRHGTGTEAHPLVSGLGRPLLSTMNRYLALLYPGYLALPYLALPHRALPYLALLDLALSHLALPHHALPCIASPCIAWPVLQCRYLDECYVYMLYPRVFVRRM